MSEYKVEVDTDGTKCWYLNGKFHREDGPAIEYADGDKRWYLNGKLHREDGPAVEDANGDKCWYLNGKKLTAQERSLVLGMQMFEYTCDNWVVIKMKGDDPHYRLLVGTSGGYLDGDSWRMNSGITKVEEDEAFYYYFYGSSGSRYRCCKGSYTLRMNNAHIWDQLQELHGNKVEMMPEDTDWMNMDWIIK